MYGGRGGYDRPPPREFRPPKSTGFRVYVRGLPKSASWQDLKVKPCEVPGRAGRARPSLSLSSLPVAALTALPCRPAFLLSSCHLLSLTPRHAHTCQPLHLVPSPPPRACHCHTQDHFRKYVKPTFTDVVREGDGVSGIVEFATQEDMDYAIRKLDNSEFRNPFDSNYIRLEEDRPAGGHRDERPRSRSRSPLERGRSRSPRSR